MSASPNENLYPWERAIEQRCRMDFLFRIQTQDIIDGYPIGSDYRAWPRVFRVFLAVEDEREQCTSFFGRAYRKYLRIMPGGGGLDLPVWWFDVNGYVPERYGYDPPVIRYVPAEWVPLGSGAYEARGWVAENVIEAMP